eukprot:6710059-Pyramimonas_sp.AAC.2
MCVRAVLRREDAAFWGSFAVETQRKGSAAKRERFGWAGLREEQQKKGGAAENARLLRLVNAYNAYNASTTF